MTEPHGYILGQSERAARRLEIQDAHFADESECLLDELALRPNDRVVELGCGPGGLSRRILRRLGAGSGTSHDRPNLRISRMIGSSARPFAVSSYSTRGGDSG